MLDAVFSTDRDAVLAAVPLIGALLLGFFRLDTLLAAPQRPVPRIPPLTVGPRTARLPVSTRTASPSSAIPMAAASPCAGKPPHPPAPQGRGTLEDHCDALYGTASSGL